MQKKQSYARELRQLAESVIEKLIAEGVIQEYQKEDLVTSLVRQWITYEGKAALYLGDRPVCFVVNKTPLGRPYAVSNPGKPAWLSEVARIWKIAPDDLPDVIEQLNRGQSAEVTNEEGIPLRLWIDPRENKQGVEPLTEGVSPAYAKVDYRQMAAYQMKKRFGSTLAPDELEALADSVAIQWQKYEGHACLFVAGTRLRFRLSERPDGVAVVAFGRDETQLEEFLCSLGIPATGLTEVLAEINLGQKVEFHDRKGQRSFLWHNPKELRIIVETHRSASPPQASGGPLFCPRCNAALLPWVNGEPPRVCGQCGEELGGS
jgi:hypothetical protein